MTCDDLTCFFVPITASVTTPTTKKSDTDNTSITIPIQIEVEKSDKPLNGEEVIFFLTKAKKV